MIRGLIRRAERTFSDVREVVERALLAAKQAADEAEYDLRGTLPRMRITELRDTITKPVVTIHNAMQALPRFYFPGIERYADRGFTVNGGVLVVSWGCFEGVAEGFREFMRELDIGPDVVIEIEVPPSVDLYEAILRSPEARTAILRYVTEDGCKIQFFNTREGIEERFAEDLGLTWNRHVASFPSHWADQGNDKGYVRMLAKKLLATSKWRRDIFPKNVVLTPRFRVGRRYQILGWYAFMRVMNGGRVAIKERSQASGIGQLYTDDFTKVMGFANGSEGLRRKAIIEVDIGPHQSMTHIDVYDGGNVVDSWQTIQLIGEVAGKKVDLGRVVSDDQLPWLSRDDYAFMRRVAKTMNSEVLRHIEAPTGVMCWDCAHATDSGTRYALELNMRITFSWYVRQMMLRVKELLGVEKVTAIQVLVRPETARSLRELQEQLGNLVFSRERGEGALPMALRCLESKEPYTYMVVIGATVERALELADSVAAALADTTLQRALQELAGM